MHFADMMWGWGFGGWWRWPMLIGMIAFWVGVVVLMVWLIKALAVGTAQLSPSPPRETPQDVLKRRYAAGEIDREDFEQKKHELF
ncbi:MAG TPA: SHOCT domain-containing protein [Thermoleophilia bacterium]|nr:SHOCT domain-containing protein [Thermoleophilia bacterium]